MTLLDATLAAWARPDVPWPPWMAPYRAAATQVAVAHTEGCPLVVALAQVMSQRAPDEVISLRAGPLRFVPHHDLSKGEAYETFIDRTACVPTRVNLHDLFNALVWLTFPAVKRRLNELQAEQIAAAGVGATRGPLRDALTVFDENGAWWQAPEVLVQALHRHDWHDLFITHRAAWQHSRLTLFGHALLEKLLQPRKPITAHVWRVREALDAPGHLISMLTTTQTLAAKLPLPVLGVPGWWPGNEAPGFYDDAAVFRKATV